MNIEALRLAGWKTYLVVAAGVIVYGLEAMGLLEAGTTDKLDGLLAILGFGTLRAAVGKVGK